MTHHYGLSFLTFYRFLLVDVFGSSPRSWGEPYGVSLHLLHCFLTCANALCQHIQVYVVSVFLALVMQPATPYCLCSFTCSFPDCRKSCHSCGGLKWHSCTHHGHVACIPVTEFMSMMDIPYIFLSPDQLPYISFKDFFTSPDQMHSVMSSLI